MIKFHCPQCDKKIGVPQEFAGKLVRCPRCKQPARVPELEPEPLEEQIADSVWSEDMFAAQQDEPPGQPDQQQLSDRCPQCKVVLPTDSEFCVNCGYALYPSQFKGSIQNTTATGKKTGRTILIVGVSVSLLILMGVFAWSIVSDFISSENETNARYAQVQEFTEEYINLLSMGKIDQTREFLSPKLINDINENDMQLFTEFLSKIDIQDLECILKGSEERLDGMQFYLCYNCNYQDETYQIATSVMKIDGNFSIDGIVLGDSYDTIFSIGPYSYEDITASALMGEFTNYAPILTKAFTGLIVVVLVLGIIQIASYWMVFNKAGEPGWAAIIPFYNMWVLAEVADKPGWLGIAMCFAGGIPIIGPFVQLYLLVSISFGVAKTFGRGLGFGLGLSFLPLIFYPILAFSEN